MIQTHEVPLTEGRAIAYKSWMYLHDHHRPTVLVCVMGGGGGGGVDKQDDTSLC
jgi:hypothetical protein